MEPVVTDPFPKEPPLRQARRYSDRDLRGQALPGELRWLYDHPVLWLRALIETKKDVETHIAQMHRDLDEIKPLPGQDPSEYLKAKADVAERAAARLYFRRQVGRRRAEVTSLIGYNPVTVGDIVGHLATIVRLLDDDDVYAATQSALAMIKRLTEKREQRP